MKKWRGGAQLCARKTRKKGEVERISGARRTRACTHKSRSRQPSVNVRFTPRRRTFIATVEMSALGQKRTSAGLFDYLIGADGRAFWCLGAGRSWNVGR